MRKRATAIAVARLDVDVIGLQEVFRFQRRYLERTVGGRWTGLGRHGAGKGEQCPIIVFDDDLEIVDQATRWFGATPDTPGSRLPGASFPRIATFVDCRRQDSDRVFRIVNVHLDEHLTDNRAASVTQLLDWIDDDLPTVVLGDFNTTPDDEAVTGPLSARDFRLAPARGGTNHDFTGHGKNTIDQIWFSRAWAVEEAEVVHIRPFGRLPSDHWPVRAVAQL